MKSLCVFLNKVDMNQKGLYVCINGNSLIEHSDISFVVMYEQYGRYPIFPKFNMVLSKELWGFKGSAIATDVESAQILLKCPTIKQRYLYVWDMEWILKPKNYLYYHDIYCNKDIELIARSTYHADIIEKCWKKPKYILNNFDYETLIKIAENS